MRIHVFLAAYGLSDDLVRCYQTANGPGLNWQLYLHSQFPAVVAACEYLATNKNVAYWAYGENRGMSKSINEAIYYAKVAHADVFVAINDDVQCPYPRLLELVSAAQANPLASHVEVYGYTERVGKQTPLGFSCCAWNMAIFDTVGYFDEGFDPFYFMDCDWKYRARLLGAEPAVVLAMPDVIHAGSKTVTHVAGASDWMSGVFDRSLARYAAKWSGDQTLERFTVPFNDDRNRLDITWDERREPYGVGR